MKIATILLLLCIASTALGQTGTVATLPSSSEGTITACDAYSNCTAPVNNPRVFSGTVMNTTFPTQTGTVLVVGGACATLSACLTVANCGDTIQIPEYGNNPANIVQISSSGITLPSKAAGGSGWILIESGSMASLPAAGNRIFNFLDPVARGHMARIQLNAIVSSNNLFTLAFGNTCGYWLAGIEGYAVGGTPALSAIGVAAGSGTTQLVQVAGNHFVADRTYFHGNDAFTFPATGCYVTGGVATVLATNYFQVGDTATISGFTGACAALNTTTCAGSTPCVEHQYVSVGAVPVSAVDTSFISAQLTSGVNGFGPNHNQWQITTATSFVTSVGTRVIIEPGTLGSNAACGANCDPHLTGDRTVLNTLAPTATTFVIQAASGQCASGCLPEPLTSMNVRTFSNYFSFPTSVSLPSCTSGSPCTDSGTAFDPKSPQQDGTLANRQLLQTAYNFSGCDFCAVINSYVDQATSVTGVDTHAIESLAVLTGAGTNGPVKVYNNYLESGGEAIEVGGAAPSPKTLATVQPHDWEIADGVWSCPEYALYTTALNYPRILGGLGDYKANIEFKTIRRALIYGNVMHGCWAHNGDTGSYGNNFRFEMRGNQSGLYTTSWDITMVNNWLDSAHIPFGADGWTGGACDFTTTAGSVCQMLADPTTLNGAQRYTVQNNAALFRQIFSASDVGAYNPGNIANLGYFLGNNLLGASIYHNTWYTPGDYFQANTGGPWLSHASPPSRATFTFADVQTVPNNPPCRGANWAVGDIFEPDPTATSCSNIRFQVTAVGSGGCVSTAAIATNAPYIDVACPSLHGGILNVNTETTGSTSGTTSTITSISVGGTPATITVHFTATATFALNSTVWLSGLSGASAVLNNKTLVIATISGSTITATTGTWTTSGIANPYGPSTESSGVASVGPACFCAGGGGSCTSFGVNLHTPQLPVNVYISDNIFHELTSNTTSGHGQAALDLYSQSASPFVFSGNLVNTTVSGTHSPSLSPFTVTDCVVIASGSPTNYQTATANSNCQYGSTLSSGGVTQLGSQMLPIAANDPSYYLQVPYLRSGFNIGNLELQNPYSRQFSGSPGTACAAYSPTNQKGYLNCVGADFQSPFGLIQATAVAISGVTCGTTPVITAATPQAAAVGEAYSFTMTATCGSGSYTTWTLSSGSLPSGLTQSGSVISGTPTASGSFTASFTVTDSASHTSAPQAFTFSVATRLTMTPATLPSVVIPNSYNYTLAYTGGINPFTCLLASGSLPAGLTLGTNCSITGSTASATAGSYVFTAQVQDAGITNCTSANAPACHSYTIVVNNALQVTTTSLPSGTQGVAYTTTLTATGGTPPYTWTLTSGTLPTGITLTGATGVVAGTPSVSGTFTPGFTVTDSTSLTATSGSLNLVISPTTNPLIVVLPCTVGNTCSTTISAGTFLNQLLAASGGTPPYTNWNLSSGTLPAGVSIVQIGNNWTIQGYPTQIGSFTAVERVTDSAGQQANGGSYTITVTPATGGSVEGSFKGAIK